MGAAQPRDDVHREHQKAQKEGRRGNCRYLEIISKQELDSPQTPYNFTRPLILQRFTTVRERAMSDKDNEFSRISWNDWHQPPEGAITLRSIPLAGATFDNPDGVNRQAVLAQVEQWERVNLVRETDNPYDVNAVAVISSKGQLGYIPREHAQRIARHMDSGYSTLAKLSGVFGGQDGKSHGAKLEVHLIPPTGTSKILATVVGITGKNEYGAERKEVAECLEVGEQVFLEQDWDERTGASTFRVSDASDGGFGKLNSKDTKKLDQIFFNVENIEAFVSFAEIDENDRPHIEIAITCFSH